MKERLRHYMSNAPCPTCQGTRLRTEARHVLLRCGDRPLGITEITAATIDRALEIFASLHLDREQQAHRRTDPPGDQRAARVPRVGGLELLDARSRQHHALRRRSAAHPTRHAGRIGPRRRVLRPRRAHDRTAPARQRPAHRDAAPSRGHRQYRPGGRARRGDDPRRRPRGRHRSRPRPPTAAPWSPRAPSTTSSPARTRSPVTSSRARAASPFPRSGRQIDPSPVPGGEGRPRQQPQGRSTSSFLCTA